ncbi:MAG: protein kinase, partial [bacterium]|nr:protein kinase [bacterium]
IYEARNFRVKTNYIEISALYELTRRPFRKILAEQEQVVADESEKNVRYGKVQLPEDLSSLPVATMFESTLIKAPTREQQRAQELADTETESLRVKEKALSTQLREPLKLESFIRNRINTLKTKISTLESADIPDNNEIAELQSELAEMNESLVKWQADYEAGTKKLQSLRNEIRAISNRVHETMGDNRVLFLVEELVVGKNIFEKFSDPENPISFTDTIKIIDQLLQAVNYTHDNGVYNKDLKPQNVMITDDGTLKIIDFGIAFIKRQADRQIKFKQPIGYQKSNKPTYAIPGSESIIGTQRYMSVWEKDFSSTNPIKARLDDIETKYADNPDVMHKAKVQAQEDYARSRDYFAVGKLMIALARTHLKNWGALSPNEKSEYYVLTYLANTLITESSRFPTEGLPYTPLSTIIDMFQRRHDPEIQSHAMSVSSMNLEVMARQCQNAKTLNELPDLSTLQPLQIKEPEAELQPQQNAETLSTQQADSEVLNEIKNLATNIDEIVDNEASNTNYDDQPGA